MKKFKVVSDIDHSCRVLAIVCTNKGCKSQQASVSEKPKVHKSPKPLYNFGYSHLQIPIRHEIYCHHAPWRT